MREAVAGLVLLIPSVVMAAGPGDAEPAAEKVTLAAAVQRALQRNPSVAVAVQEVVRADALITQARAGWLPILMTTVATIVGLIPMALGIGEGSETNLPLARAVIGGLTVSTVFTLFLVPALYTALERFSKRSHAPEDDDGAPGGAVHA